MASAQAGICALCQSRPLKVIDHDHATGRVRGLLCHRCNIMLSALDDVDFRKRATRYLQCE